MPTFQRAVRSLEGLYAQGPATVVPISGSTYTVAPSTNGGRTMSITAATTTITLPAVNASANSPISGPGQDPNTQNNFGIAYTFFLPATATAVKIVTATGDYLAGSVDMNSATGGASNGYCADGSTTRSINFNGTTTGGIIGTFVTVTAIAAHMYMVSGSVIGSGTLATPFATS